MRLGKVVPGRDSVGGAEDGRTEGLMWASVEASRWR